MANLSVRKNDSATDVGVLFTLYQYVDRTLATPNNRLMRLRKRPLYKNRTIFTEK